LSTPAQTGDILFPPDAELIEYLSSNGVNILSAFLGSSPIMGWKNTTALLRRKQTALQPMLAVPLLTAEDREEVQRNLVLLMT